VPTAPGRRDARGRGGSEAARTVIAVLRLVVSWAIRENLIKRTDNPASDMEKNLPKKRKKDRVLSLDEARIVTTYSQTRWTLLWGPASAV
jgi:hypothetical protein